MRSLAPVHTPTRSPILALLAAAVLASVAGLRGPAAAQVEVLGGLSRRLELGPGEQAEGRVMVRNADERPQVVRVYLTDYQSLADGRTAYGDPAANPRSNAAWVHLVPQEQEIPPHSTAGFTYLIRVPEADSLAGTYWSMLMVEPVPKEELTPPAERPGQVRVTLRSVVRTGIHLVTNIRGGGRWDLRFAARELERQDGRVFLRLDLENTGDRALGLTVWAELLDSLGVPLGRFDAERVGMYPGSAARARIDLTGVPPGAYQALVVADNGDEHVFGARYELVIPD